jgi:signal transduction histidine kinase
MANGRETAARRLSQVIDQNRPEIERRWLERVERDICRTPGIELTRLRDGLPEYLVALVKLLSREGGRPDFAQRAEPIWSTVAREHGITRVRIGFDINQLIHEFIILRHVIDDVAVENGLSAERGYAALTDCLEGAIAVAVDAYVDARDYEARRKQAENIGFLTHELRNPLSTATMAASQLRRHATPEQLHLLDTLDRSQKRLADLIDSVLLTERLEVGKVDCRPVDVKLGRVLGPALEAAQSAAKQKGLDFRAKYDPELSVRVDPLLTRSAVQNIADNAAKFTDDGFVEVVVDERPEEFVVHVRDSCDGISPEELRTIFEPFERGTTGKSGTGLGLAIAKHAVQVQGGSIQVESREASGCHFWITLPKRVSTPDGRA